MNDMNENLNTSPQKNSMQTCQTCLFRDHSDASNRDNCFRFARFVDHLLHEASRDCDYWSPSPSHS
jgi:hypothetical protein